MSLGCSDSRVRVRFASHEPVRLAKFHPPTYFHFRFACRVISRQEKRILLRQV